MFRWQHCALPLRSSLQHQLLAQLCARPLRIFWSKIVSIAQIHNGQGTALARFSQVRKILVKVCGMEGEVHLSAHRCSPPEMITTT